MAKYLVALITIWLAFVPSMAEAANCFWVLGTGTYSTTNTASWSSTSGGNPGTQPCAAVGNVPKQTADIATFDGNSGGGTVTVDSTMNGTTVNSLAAGAFTGTLDFSVNNPSMSFSTTGVGIEFGGTGSGRIFKLGSGTFIFANGGAFDFATTTGAGTQSLASATLVFNSLSLAGQQAFSGGGFSYGTLTINGRSSGQGAGIAQANSFAVLNLSAPLVLSAVTGQTIGALNVSGSGASYVMFPGITVQSTASTLAVTTANVDHAILRGVVFAGAAVTATNSIDLGNNNMNGGSITPPTSGAPSHIIGVN